MKLEEGKRKLPDGWQWVKLGDVCEFVGGMQPPKYVFQYEPLPGYVRLVQIQDFRRSDVAVYIPAKEAKRTFDETDVMIGRYGPPLFQILRGLSGAYNVALIKTVPKTNLLKDYLYYLLQEPSIQNAVIAQSQRSAGQTGVQKEFLERLEIPLPPLDEQKRIAAILNEKMEAVERSRQATLAQLEAAKALPSAYLRAVFNSPEAQNWERKRLGDVAKLERGKFSPRPRNDPRYYGGAYPWIQTGEVEAAQKYITTYRNTLNDQGLAVSKMFPKGTLVMTIAATIGAVGILSFDSCMPDSLVGITPIGGVSETEFIYYNLLFIRNHLKFIAPQVAQANLKLSLLEPIIIKLPSLPKQKHITAELNEQMTKVEKLHKSLEEQLDTINKLPAAFLRQAFNGEL